MILFISHMSLYVTHTMSVKFSEDNFQLFKSEKQLCPYYYLATRIQLKFDECHYTRVDEREVLNDDHIECGTCLMGNEVFSSPLTAVHR